MNTISQIVPEMPKSANEDMIQWANEFNRNLQTMCSHIVDGSVDRQYPEVIDLLQKQYEELRDEINTLKQEIEDLQRTE